MAHKEKTRFVITYKDPKDNEIVSIDARRVSDSSLGLSFIAISDFVFEKNNLVVTPTQEAMEKRLADVKTLHLSIYMILSVKEIGQKNRGLSFEKDRSNLVVLPTGDTSPKA